MSINKHNSRRTFIKHSSIGLGAGIIDFSPAGSIISVDRNHEKLPFEIMVATIDLRDGLKDMVVEERLSRVLRSMKNVAGLKPDIICIPEGFVNHRLGKFISLKAISQERTVHSDITTKISGFARENKCYVTCPVITREGKSYFSSTMVIDREGKLRGIYDKMFPTRKEMSPDADGIRITPGTSRQPLIETDFGPIGLQMGDDIYNTGSWQNLAKKGAKIIVYSSTFPGGRMLNYHSVRNDCYLISSTFTDARIIDISGNDLDRTSEFIRYSWSRINKERTNILTFPNRLPELFRKYGNRLQLKAWGNTDMLTIESRDPALKVSDVLKEFDMQTYAELISSETEIQNQYRKDL